MEASRVVCSALKLRFVPVNASYYNLHCSESDRTERSQVFLDRTNTTVPFTVTQYCCQVSEINCTPILTRIFSAVVFLSSVVSSKSLCSSWSSIDDIPSSQDCNVGDLSSERSHDSECRQVKKVETQKN